LNSSRRALEIIERLARDHPTDLAFQNDRAKIHYNIGILVYNAGDSAEALANLSYMAKSFTAEAIWDVEDDELLEAARSHLRELSERHAPAP
jgi:hypothetical protein